MKDMKNMKELKIDYPTEKIKVYRFMGFEEFETLSKSETIYGFNGYGLTFYPEKTTGENADGNIIQLTLNDFIPRESLKTGLPDSHTHGILIEFETDLRYIMREKKRHGELIAVLYNAKMYNTKIFKPIKYATFDSKNVNEIIWKEFR